MNEVAIALSTILEKVERQEELQRDDLSTLLSLNEKTDIENLYQAAYAMKDRTVGTTVYFRGIIELSNVCEKDCYYCGIRKSNVHATRFQMTEEEIVHAAVWSYEQNYGSIVLQSGERRDPHFVDFIEGILTTIRERCDGELGITLSLGEQSYDTYKRWFDAGAHRYLLRIETSNPGLYKRLHPSDHSFEVRLECLDLLRKAGYQVGTGVMIGLPFQTIEQLADDILFFKRHDIDMIGMGPYIVHEETPLAQYASGNDNGQEQELSLELGLKMIAVTRLALRDVNIAATTALQALHAQGRELGLQAGANIIMPNVTDQKYRAAYQLYQNKPCIDENSSMCRACLGHRISGIGETIGYGKWGDSPHFFARTQL
ncbi:[FeFe] hydrogenase H-cluster radical SAM maturase HydE [candidate division KSB3 bacterium]|uniref:[FeFe] hydrogenase H-cluster radical SAM maturase HydE n=1 Tax=candidate division KSB3 bacterium TaxID=2044937 RepID=A0A2G6K7C5_9BACT|nr:MAG: [FeFe] hydrogenase H-cluster radical SAM maturase HydE [candidate division KSB3 bacterium]